MTQTWRESMLPASFRGVPFFVDAATVPVGRKVQLHEYPKRDAAYAEPMGKVARVHKVTAFVIGADCFEQRDALLKALESEGEGELVHPWLGRLQVVAGECDMSHERTAGGMVRFELTFYPGTPQSSPTARANTAQQAAGASQGLWSSAVNRYQTAMEGVDAARINVAGLQNTLSGVFTVIGRNFSPLLGTYSSASALAYGLTNAPAGISSLFSSYFADLGRSSGSSASSGSAAATSFGDYGGAVAALSRQSGDANSIDTVQGSSGASTAAAAQALANLVQDALLTQAVATVAQVPVAQPVPGAAGAASLEQQLVEPVQVDDVPVANEVISARDELDGAYWTAALKADAGHYFALNTARQHAVRHLTVVAASGVQLVSVTPAESLPALVLAYRRFGDASRELEVVQRNKIRHPGFVPAVPLQIAKE